jgi:hypothetical protein
MLFVFNLQNMSTVRHRCRSYMSPPGIVGCGRKVERVKKPTSIPETKKESPPMKLHGNPEISPVRRSSQEPHHSQKLVDVAIKMGLKPGRLY